jgi:membrane glycosyltransferase
MQDLKSTLQAPLPAEGTAERFPQQDLWRFDRASRREYQRDPASIFRRLFVFGGALLLTIYLTRELCLVLAVGGFAELEIVLIGLFVLNIAWLSLSFMTALAGFIVTAFGMKPSIVPTPTREQLKSPPRGRSAILIATYNESPERIFGMALATMKELAESGQGDQFDVFILSDTTDPDIWVHEEAAFNAARTRPAEGPRLYYRRRAANTGKKAGNIADWCRRWGPGYDYMIVLDADSLMTGDSLIQMAHSMDLMPEAALIQTVPVTIGRNTLFARMQQFAGCVYGPIMAAGLAFWHRGTGNFWGHNAIIRVRAFMESAGLPHLPGAPPFGGQILSHDFVEAALMCRAGWRVCMAPEIKGSYEEIPPSLIDFATRDRRWCQGNLQHAMLLGAKGLRPLSRVHLGMGIMAYLSALFWLVFIVAALTLTIQQLTAKPIYFGGDQTLFPTWPMQDSERALSLLFWTLTLLLLPKMFGFFVVLFDNVRRRGTGGVLGLAGSVIMETVLSSLFAHVMMMVQSAAIFDIIRGRDSGWNPQRRDDGSLPMSWVLRYHMVHMMVGIGLGILTFVMSTALFLWMLPATLGLGFSGPLSHAAAKRKWGERFRQMNLFRIPEEDNPPPIALSARHHTDLLAREFSKHEAISQLARDPQLRHLHRQLIELQPVTREARISPSLAVGRAKLEISADLPELLRLLKPNEKAAILSDPESLARLEAMLAPYIQSTGSANGADSGNQAAAVSP